MSEFYQDNGVELLPGESVVLTSGGSWRVKSPTTQLTPIEALTGFVAWLTTREEATSFGSDNDCSEASDILRRFAETNQLGYCRPEYTQYLKMPSETEELGADWVRLKYRDGLALYEHKLCGCRNAVELEHNLIPDNYDFTHLTTCSGQQEALTTTSTEDSPMAITEVLSSLFSALDSWGAALWTTGRVNTEKECELIRIWNVYQTNLRVHQESLLDVQVPEDTEGVAINTTGLDRDAWVQIKTTTKDSTLWEHPFCGCRNEFEGGLASMDGRFCHLAVCAFADSPEPKLNDGWQLFPDKFSNGGRVKHSDWDCKNKSEPRVPLYEIERDEMAVNRRFGGIEAMLESLVQQVENMSAQVIKESSDLTTLQASVDSLRSLVATRTQRYSASPPK